MLILARWATIRKRDITFSTGCDFSFDVSKYWWHCPRGCARFAEILSKLTQTWSSGATECRVWIGNCNVKVWKSTEHKLHNIWRSVKFQQNEHTPECYWEKPLVWCPFPLRSCARWGEHFISQTGHIGYEILFWCVKEMALIFSSQ